MKKSYTDVSDEEIFRRLREILAEVNPEFAGGMPEYAGLMREIGLRFKWIPEMIVKTRFARVRSSRFNSEDLLQAGLVGLMKAIPRFDPAKGIGFGAYAYGSCLGAIRDEIRIVSGSFVEDGKRIHIEPVSLSEYSEEKTNLGYRCKFEQQEIDRQTPGPRETLELKDSFKGLLKKAPAKYRKILEQYYGKNLKMKEISVNLGMSEAMVSIRHREVIEHLRRKVRKEL